MYRHRDEQGRELPLPVSKVVCVGRNYLAHIEELGNPVPQTPLLFMKPASAIAELEAGVQLPDCEYQCHYETEIAVLIEHPLSKAGIEEVSRSVWGYGLGLDLTLRELQTQLKQKGHPWELAKAFDASCPLSGFVSKNQVEEPHSLTFELRVNGEPAQQGNVKRMMMPMFELIAHISHFFSLQPGDVVLTGTPEGVGVLASGDDLALSLDKYLRIKTKVM